MRALMLSSIAIATLTAGGMMRAAVRGVDALSQVAAPKTCSGGPFYYDRRLTLAQPLRRVKPVFSRASRDIHRGSICLMTAYVSKDGAVCGAELQWQLDAPTTQACVAAASRWLFRPAQFNGHPVASVYHFSMPIE